MKKIIIGVIAVVAIVAVAGAYYFPKNLKQISLGSSSVGSTFLNAKFAGVTATFTTATSTSVLNNDASDRYIIALKYGCNSVGSSFTAFTGVPLISAGLTLKAATTTTAAPFAPLSVTNSNLAVNTTIATSSAASGFLTFASSTMALTGTAYFNQVWAAGSYLTFFTNATNTAVCTVGVEYLPS